jgi:hypothetical protein
VAKEDRPADGSRIYFSQARAAQETFKTLKRSASPFFFFFLFTPDRRGVTLTGNIQAMIVVYGSGLNFATVVAHELGHGVGIEGHTGTSPLLMNEDPWAGDYVITLWESNKFDQ